MVCTFFMETSILIRGEILLGLERKTNKHTMALKHSDKTIEKALYVYMLQPLCMSGLRSTQK
jgi:hypothetical protein